MKKWQKIGTGAGAVVVLGGVVWFSIYQVNKGVISVQTGKVVRQDLTSIVTASGEVRPKNYTNVLGEGFGKITEIVVKEGDHVKRGDVLLRLENIQPAADVDAQQASISSGEASLKAAESALQLTQAEVAQAKADFERSKSDWERAQKLYGDGLISKQDYDARAATFGSDRAKVEQKTALLQQRRAELDYAHWVLAQGQALLARTKDVLRKTTYTAPIDGIVSYIAARVGENVVPGIQNATGSFLLTISDMSVVTAEVKVDETDITNVRENQSAEVTIDAIPGKVFNGHVTEVGELAILRSSGQAATTQTTANTQEARDFKVVVTLDNPPDSLRPGLSSTAKVQTAHKNNVLTIPIQALAMRSRKDIEEAKSGKGGTGVTLAASKPSAPGGLKGEIQGVFVLRGKKVDFVPVTTGITGITDIEISSGLRDGDEIVTGSYKALRTLRPGASVKVDNTPPKPQETTS